MAMPPPQPGPLHPFRVTIRTLVIFHRARNLPAVSATISAVRRPNAAPTGLKPLVFLLCLLPLGLLIWRGFEAELGANPVETLEHATGDWALRLLLLTLCATPLRQISGWSWPLRLRRMLGLYTFFYASLHMALYFTLDLELDFYMLGSEVLKRPYLSVGFLAWALLVPLALTSTDRMIRRLGRRWKSLHRSVYVIGVLAVLHYLWLVKADVREPLLYGAILIVLLGWRAWQERRDRKGGRRAQATRPV